MNSKKRKVKYAHEKSETDYKKLAKSKKEEDKKIFSVLKLIRTKVARNFLSGKRIPNHKIPSIYKKWYNVKNLWELDVLIDETVLYSITVKEILIVDVV